MSDYKNLNNNNDVLINLKSLIKEIIKISIGDENSMKEMANKTVVSSVDGTTMPKYFMHFTNVSGKSGINPRSQWIPGIYGYPLSENNLKRFLDDDLEFGTKRKYISIGELIESPRIIWPGINDILSIDMKEKLYKFIEKEMPGYNEKDVKIIRDLGEENNIYQLFDNIIHYQYRGNDFNTFRAMKELQLDGMIAFDHEFHNDIESEIYITNPKCFKFIDQLRNKSKITGTERNYIWNYE